MASERRGSFRDRLHRSPGRLSHRTRIPFAKSRWATGFGMYDPRSPEIVRRRVVDGDPDVDLGEVSRDSPFGYALIGAREGEERPLHLPGQAVRPIRIVLIGDKGR